MKGQPLGRLSANARKPGQFGNEILDDAHNSEMRGEGHCLRLPHFRLEHVRGAPLHLGDRGQDQVGEKLCVMTGEDRRIDIQGAEHTPAVRRHPYHASAGGSFDSPIGEIGLQLLELPLHLLAELEKLLNHG